MNNFKRNIIILVAISVISIFFSFKNNPTPPDTSSKERITNTSISNPSITQESSEKTHLDSKDKITKDSSQKNIIKNNILEDYESDYVEYSELNQLKEDDIQHQENVAKNKALVPSPNKDRANNSDTTNNSDISSNNKQSYTNVVSDKKYLSKNIKTGKTSTKIVLQNIELNNNNIKELNGIIAEIKANRSLTPQLISYDNTNVFSFDLGMGNVPVLNQGSHGTCVTFTVTALLNAKMNAGDYISQQCLLDLGKTIMADISGQMSGWNGLKTNETVLNRIKSYGVIDKKACPTTYSNPNSNISYNNYKNSSSNTWSNDFTWQKLKSKDIEQIKSALNRNNRVAISTILHTDYVLGSSIYNSNTGLWKLPNDLDTFMNELYSGKIGAHAVVVTGYDDDKQLLKIRNSWGTYFGVKGEYYMTYEYYKLLNFEAIEVM